MKPVWKNKGPGFYLTPCLRGTPGRIRTRDLLVSRHALLYISILDQ